MSEIIPLDELEAKLEALEPSTRERVVRKIIMAALGSVPWVGGFLTAAQSYSEEGGQVRTNEIIRQWLAEHQKKWKELESDLSNVVRRLDEVGEDVKERLESEDYLVLVRRAFRSWDTADTREKKEYVCRLISNAGASNVSDDDLIRLFLDWLDRYHEIHFKVIREIYKRPGITRRGIWQNISGVFPREDSSQADLFRLLIGDLSTGRVVRQERSTTMGGEFLRKQQPKTKSPSSIMKSAFCDEEGYELTNLGREFVHYVFTDIVKRISN